MCVTYCHRRRVLYWNHDPCSFEFCPFTAEEPGRCNSCRHRQAAGGICDLTRAPLSATEGRGGCCHWNVEPVTGPQLVTPEMLTPLSVGSEPVEAVLADLDAPHVIDEAGQVWVDPDRLGLPEICGLGTDDLTPELLDWSEWKETWWGDE